MCKSSGRCPTFLLTVSKSECANRVEESCLGDSAAYTDYGTGCHSGIIEATNGD